MLGAFASDADLVGRAWCPTPGALERIAASGAVVPVAPNVDALTRGNARETFAWLDPLEGTHTCGSLEEVEQALSRPGVERASDRPPAWVLRASLSTAGRDRLVVESTSAGLRRFVEKALPGGPIHVEPFVDIESEYALHGWVERDGDVHSGHVLAQRARGGTWVASAPAEPCEHTRRIERAHTSVAARLTEVGYFGPFGMDAFTWRDAAGELHLHAPSDVNARYTMSFAMGAPHLVGGPIE